MKGKDINNGLGWSSEGMTAEGASIQLAELKKAKKSGEGPVTMQEKRSKAELERKERERQEEEARKQAEQEAKANRSFSDFFENDYWPVAQSSKKKESYRKEREHFEKWIQPVVGAMSFKEIGQLQVEKIKRDMQ